MNGKHRAYTGNHTAVATTFAIPGCPTCHLDWVSQESHDLYITLEDGKVYIKMLGRTSATNRAGEPYYASLHVIFWREGRQTHHKLTVKMGFRIQSDGFQVMGEEKASCYMRATTDYRGELSYYPSL
jgi:hypothetical protein